MLEPASALRRLLIVLAFCLTPSLSFSADDKGIPDVLKPWKDWILYKHPDLNCPIAHDDAGRRFCAWPSALDLVVTRQSASFTQRWTVYAPGWVNLPGDESAWPGNVTVNGRSMPITVREERPNIYLKPGDYQISGTITWPRRPEFLQIPPRSGIVSLTLDGKRIDQKNIDPDGKLWFGKMAGAAPADGAVDAVVAQVFRKLKDGVPVVLESEVHLKVSGKDRELVLGKLLLSDAMPLRFESPLPARVEPDGRLRIQTRAGEWVVKLSAKYPGPVTEFAMQKMDGVWPEEEFWVFEADRWLRVVTLSGAKLIDPQQTSLPDEWKALPAYLLQPDVRLALEEQQRGDAGPAGDKLNLSRELWLDFDGGGFTLRDKITGSISRISRLDMLPGFSPGRIEVDEEPQLITRTAGDAAGVEVRQGKIDLLAVSRREGATPDFSATGWNHDFDSVKTRLILPPGWSILTALGADSAHGSWVQDWSLWDIFLVLIIAVSVGRLIHPVWGVVAAITLTLIYHESDAPRFLWLNILAAVALFKVLPDGKARRVMRFYVFASLLMLVLMGLKFSVDQVRQGIYPQLERTHFKGFDFPGPVSLMRAMDKASPYQQDYAEEEFGLRLQESKRKTSRTSSFYLSVKEKPKGFDAAAQIQTGPGEPTWQWNSVSLVWNGPVTQDQMVRLVFVPPAANRALRFIRVILLALLVSALFAYALVLNNRTTVFRLPFMPATTAVMLILVAVFLSPHPAAADEDIEPEQDDVVQVVKEPTPPAEKPAFTNLLHELEGRLTEAPSCLPNCASLTRGHVQMSNAGALFRLQIDALAPVAVPLPAHRDHWIPTTVRLDGDTRAVVSRDQNGQLFLSLREGSHEVILQGPVAGDALQFPLNLPAHNITVDAPGWHVSGLIDGRVPGNSLQFHRAVKDHARRQDVILPDPIAPFVSVEHTLYLDLEWQVRSVVTRLAPEREAINLQIPKLKGSSIITPNVKSENDLVKVVIPPEQSTFIWDSVLDVSDVVELAAQKTTQWIEHWVVDASTIWHVEYDGIAPIKQHVTEQGSSPRWQPWPGETLSVRVTRPPASAGATRTIESARLTTDPGNRATTHELQLNFRASQGGDYTLNLPAGAQIQKFVIDGAEQSNPQEPGAVRIPLHPGKQTATVTWQEKQGIALLTRTPEVRLGAPASNVTLKLNLPRDRWTLFVGGPRLGPAMLYWGILVVIVILALALGRAHLIPLKSRHWLLLLIGLSTVNAVGGLIVVLWFFAMARRRTGGESLTYGWFNLTQVFLVILTFAALGSLVATIPMSLLSTPDMQITGYGSDDHHLNWYQDRISDALPQGWVLSTSIWIYRLTMLLWSLWMVFALIRWIRWGWECFSAGGIWKHAPAIETVD